MRARNIIVSLLLCVFMSFTLIQTPVIAAEDSEFVDEGSGLKFMVLTEDAGTGTVQVMQNSYSGTSYIIPGTVSDNGVAYTVTGIGYGAFSNCTNLNSVSIPNGVMYIGNFAFNGCSSLTSVSIPDGVTEIGISAFSGTGLSSIALPGSVHEIWDYAFNSCTNLAAVTFSGITPPHFNAFVFSGTAVQTFTVPRGTESSYGLALSGKLPAGTKIVPAAAVITEVSVNPPAAEVLKGNTLTCSAIVVGTGSFSPAVTWSVNSSSSRITPYDGILTVAKGESATTLTVTATSVADETVSGLATVTVKSSTPEEQFNLPAGSTCYFDLSGTSVSHGAINTALPDTSLKWVPFTYAGTINAYSLDESANGSTSASDTAGAHAGRRSLFVADYNVYLNLSWDDLNASGLIFGSSCAANGVSYLLRSLSAGSGMTGTQFTPASNEWDQLLIKGNFIHNYNGMISWGQDTSNSGTQNRIIRGYNSSEYWQPISSSFRNTAFGFRPALEIIHTDGMSSDALKAVTYDMGANGTLGSGSLTSAAVVYTGELTLPEISEANGFHYTGAAPQNGQMLGWYYGSTFYPAGRKLTSLPVGASLTAEYGVPAPTYSLAVTAGNGGSITAGSSGNYEAGTVINILATPSRNYSFSHWTSTGNGSFGNANSAGTTFTMPAGDTTITANFTYSGGDSGGNGNGGGGNSSPSTPVYTAAVKTDDTTANGIKETALPVAVDANAGRASVNVGAQLGDSIADGRTLVIDLPSIPDVESFTLSIPSEYLSNSSGEGSVSFNTDTGGITLPANMLAGFAGANGKKAEIIVGQGDKSGLPEAAKAAVGDRPLIELTLMLDGKQTGWNNPDAPVTVSIPYTPTAAELNNPESIVIWYIDGDGKAVSIPNGRYDPDAGSVIFTTTHFSSYGVGFNKVLSNDVASTAWYCKPVSFVTARGITTGTGGGNFSPGARLTRSQFIVMLMRAYGIAPDETPKVNFADAGSTYHTGYLAAAKRLGISGGTGNNLFLPDREITRQEMFTLLYNTLKIIGRLPQEDSGIALSDFSDAGLIDSWAKEAMMLLVKAGTIGGNVGKLSPTGTATRAEMAQLLYNLLSK